MAVSFGIDLRRARRCFKNIAIHFRAESTGRQSTFQFSLCKKHRKALTGLVENQLECDVQMRWQFRLAIAAVGVSFQTLC